MKTSPPCDQPAFSIAGITEALRCIVKLSLTLAILVVFVFAGNYLVTLSGLRLNATPQATHPFKMADMKGPMTVHFADASHIFYQEHFAGNDEMLRQRMQTACHQMAAASSISPTEPRKEEVSLLSKLSPEAVRTMGNGILICQMSPSLPLMVGIRSPITDLSLGTPSEIIRGARIVCWGFAMPTGPNTWNIRVVGRKDEKQGNIGSLSLPTGISRILELDYGEGGSTLAFTSNKGLGEQIERFDQHFIDQHWQRSSPWNVSSDHGSSNYTRHIGDHTERLTVRIGRDDTKGLARNIHDWHGLINLVRQPQTDYFYDK